MAGPLLIGLDVGTSAVDACAFTPNGALIAAESVPLAITYPRPGWAEQDAASWPHAAVAALRGLVAQLGPAASRVAALGLSGQCPTFALVDDAGAPLTPGLTYQDHRAGVEAARLAQTLGAQRFSARSGLVPAPYYAAPKLLWLDAHRTELRGARPWLAQPRDLVAHRLTGLLATDETHAGCTGLYDLGARRWANDWLAALGLAWLRLPPVLHASAVVGRLTPDAVRESGLPAGLPVTIGAADDFCSDLALGAVAPGLLGDTTGSSTCLDLSVTQRLGAPCLSFYAHLAPGLLFANAGLNASGATIAWAATVLAGGEVARLERLAAAALPDLDAPLLLPYLGGERAEEAAPGAWIGLRLDHDAARLARSAYEGVTFALRELIEQIRAAGYAVTEARLGGGGSRSRLWNGLKADVWGLPVRAAEQADTTALGAALLAGVASGLYRDLHDAVARAVRLGPPRQPDLAAAALYDALYRRWRAAKAHSMGAKPLAYPPIS